MVEKLYQLLSPIIQNSYYGMRIKTFLDASHIISPGKRAPDFSLKDNNGKTIQLKNFKGKYVFLDFWASWCAPCRKKHPEIVDLHNRNQNKIVFVSISFDSDHSSWTKAIELDKLTWTQLNDPQNFNGQVSEIYGIKSLPFNCLIDTNGFIIEKQISFSYLDNFIKKNL